MSFSFLTHQNFWTITSDPNKIYRDGDFLLMVLPLSCRMEIILRTDEEPFSDTVQTAYRKNQFTCAINGIQYSVDPIGLADAAIGTDPVAANHTTPDGLLVRQGKIIGGRRAPQMFFLANDALGGYAFGLGDPPLGTARGVGGLGPMIIGGLPYGVGNQCRAPAVCPPNGGVPTGMNGYVVQRNNNTYADQQSRSPTTGKTIIAANRTVGKLIILVQPNGKNGSSFDEIKSLLLGLGCEDAVFLDGSDSSMLFARGSFEARQGQRKNVRNTIGLAFYA
jgi:hypothetical protein